MNLQLHLQILSYASDVNLFCGRSEIEQCAEEDRDSSFKIATDTVQFLALCHERRAQTGASSVEDF